MPAVTARLREYALADDEARIIPDKRLDAPYQAILARAVSNVLSTEIAISTFAQIIDGLPTADVGWDRRHYHMDGDHPLDAHEDLCPGAMDTARKLSSQWTIEMLAFNPKLLKVFQAAVPGTKVFETRLIELVAVLVHQFGALLYQIDFRLHQGDVNAVLDWQAMPPPGFTGPYELVPPPPTIFYHSEYMDADIYPNGVADIVGYWTEERIFGGVVVFNRRAEEADSLNPPAIYLHPNRHGVTNRVAQLRDEQQWALVDFLLADVAKPPPTACPIPVIVDTTNRERAVAEDSITAHGIYRNIWERKPPTMEKVLYADRCARPWFDYPSSIDWRAIKEWWRMEAKKMEAGKMERRAEKAYKLKEKRKAGGSKMNRDKKGYQVEKEIPKKRKNQDEQEHQDAQDEMDNE